MFFTKKKATDPVCGMEVKVGSSTPHTHFNGKDFYFCADACRINFEKDPQQYASHLKEECCGGHKHDHEEHQHHGNCGNSHEHHQCCGKHNHSHH